MSVLSRLLALLAACALAGCMVGPNYHRPKAIVSLRYKELPGWTTATPMDAAPKGAWWEAYHDPVLSALEAQVAVSNQTLRADYYAYRQASALINEARGSLFPALTLTPQVQRESSGSSRTGTSTGSVANSAAIAGNSSLANGASTGIVNSTTSSSFTRTTYSLEGNASWDLDVWGKIRRQIESDVASAQASAALLASATLSEQALLATDYFDLRYTDQLKRLLDATVAAYQRSLTITQNQAAVGVAAPSDVLTAEVQLQSTQAADINTGVARAEYEHAIAVLTGHPPADLSLAQGVLARDVPSIPVALPATLLQRRPDIAEAERTMKAENALIGYNVAAFYPDISLTALYGYSGDPIGSLIQASNRLWSLGAAASEVLFEGGTRSAAVAAARAAYDESVANYRQTVLTALQQVEDELSSLRILGQQAQIESLAVANAERSVQIALNEYSAGTQAYTTVITAQAIALSDAQTALSIQDQRLVASVALIQALGGGFHAGDLPSADSLQRSDPLIP